MSNPFRARRKSAHTDQATPAPQTAPPVPAAAPVKTRAQLDDMRKADLVDLARARGLDDSGTRAELIDRLAP